MTEEEILQKLNILGIYSPDQLEEEDLNMWWHKKYLDIRDSQIKKETINEKLNEINQIALELSKRKKWILIKILSKSINEKDEIDEISTIKEEIESIQLQIDQAKRSFDLNKAAELEFGTLYSLQNKLKEKKVKSLYLENEVISETELYNRGVDYYNLENYGKAVENTTKVIDLNPDKPDAFLLRGLAYYHLKDYKNAIEDATKAIDLNPDEPDHFSLRGWAYYNFDKEDKAIEDANKAIDLNPDEPDYFYLRGISFFYLENYDKSLENSKRAIELNANEPKYLQLKQDSLKSHILKKIKRSFYNCDYEETILRCNEAISSNKTVADYYLYRGLSKQYSNKVYKNNFILNDFNIAIELKPDDPYIWSLRGSLKVQIDYNGNYIESAISDTSRAIEINSKKAEFYYRSGHAKYCNDQIEDALVDLNKAIKLDPDNNEGYLNACLKLIEEINGFNNSTKEDGFGYVFLAKSINSQDKYRIGTATDKGDLKRKVGNDSLIVSSKECEGYKHLATVISRRYKNNRIGNSEYFLLNNVQYNSVMKSIVRSFSKDDPAYGSGFLSNLFTD